MAISLPDARSLPDIVLNTLRLRAIRGCEMGFAQKDLALLLGVARETISVWWSAYSVEGVEGLPGDRTGRPIGSGRTLSDQQSEHIQDLIDHNKPEALGVPAPLWNRRAVQQLIRKELKIGMPVRTVGEYLKRWGYTRKKPSRHACRQDHEEVKEWLEKTYPELEKQARNEGATIFWVDETGVVADDFRGCGYARKGKRAVVEVPDPHIKVNVISAVSSEGTFRFMTYHKSMNADRFLVFLKRALSSVQGKVHLIVDRLRAHDCVKVWRWLKEHQDRIQMTLAPRRSPELNPDEYFNHDLKENINAEGLSSSKEELRQKVQRFLRQLLHWPAHVMSYFQHPSVQYASDS